MWNPIIRCVVELYFDVVMSATVNIATVTQFPLIHKLGLIKHVLTIHLICPISNISTNLDTIPLRTPKHHQFARILTAKRINEKEVWISL